MNHIGAALARVEALRNRAAAYDPAPQAGFDQLLDEATRDTEGTARLLDIRRPEPATAYTIGHLIGVTPTSTAIETIAPTPLPPPPPPVEGVMTNHELHDYLATTKLRDRNGRLISDDLTPVEGGWNGRQGALIEPAAVAWEKMREAAAVDGVELRFVDSYRSWHSQDAAHQRYLNGTKHHHVLPAGTSEHGVGLALDITNGSIIDRSDVEWQWLSANGAAYGWHPISNETWHWEFRGT